MILSLNKIKEQGGEDGMMTEERRRKRGPRVKTLKHE